MQFSHVNVFYVVADRAQKRRGLKEENGKGGEQGMIDITLKED